MQRLFPRKLTRNPIQNRVKRTDKIRGVIVIHDHKTAINEFILLWFGLGFGTIPRSPADVCALCV